MIALIGNNDQLENSSYPLEGRLEQDQESNANSAGGPGFVQARGLVGDQEEGDNVLTGEKIPSETQYKSA